ncbi:MAG: hypothetical protein AB1454_03120 [Candidatus Auribacterota bacterium]
MNLNPNKIAVHYSVLKDYITGSINPEDRNAFEEMLFLQSQRELDLFRLIPAPEDSVIPKLSETKCKRLKDIQARMDIHPSWDLTRSVLPTNEPQGSFWARAITRLCPGISVDELKIMFNLLESSYIMITTDYLLLETLARRHNAIHHACQLTLRTARQIRNADLAPPSTSREFIILRPAEYVSLSQNVHAQAM